MADGELVEVELEAVDVPTAVHTPGPRAGAAPADLPFAVDQSHALDSAPVGTIATKLSDTAVRVDDPTRGVSEHPILADDAWEYVPVGSSVALLESKLASGQASKVVMVSLPSTAYRAEVGFVAGHVHEAIAQAWPFITDEMLKVEDWTGPSRL